VSVGVDLARVERHLVGRIAGLTPPITVRRIGNGQSNITVRIDDAAGHLWVLRRPPLGPLLPSAHDVAREFRVLERLAVAGAPVPRPLLLCTDDAVTGAPFFVMEHVAGLVVDERLARARDVAWRARTGASLIDALVAIHHFDVASIGLGDLSRRGGYAARQIRRWHRQWEASKTDAIPRLDALAGRLASAAPTEDAVSLVHGDFRLDNAIVDGDGAVRAILDWELCALGSPLADLGMLIAYTPRDRDEVLPTHDGVALLPGFPLPEEIAERYQRRAGCDLGELPFWVALGCWKLAIILQGVHRRWRENPANGGRGAGDLEPYVAMLARRADEVAMAAGI
jgi:aminoglycoside phosphotransferase (APT) family kinase protein